MPHVVDGARDSGARAQISTMTIFPGDYQKLFYVFLLEDGTWFPLHQDERLKGGRLVPYLTRGDLKTRGPGTGQSKSVRNRIKEIVASGTASSLGTEQHVTASLGALRHVAATYADGLFAESRVASSKDPSRLLRDLERGVGAARRPATLPVVTHLLPALFKAREVYLNAA